MQTSAGIWSLQICIFPRMSGRSYSAGCCHRGIWGSVQEDRGRCCSDAGMLWCYQWMGRTLWNDRKGKWTAEAGACKTGRSYDYSRLSKLYETVKRESWRQSHRNLGDLKGNRTSRTGKRTGDTCCNTWCLRCQERYTDTGYNKRASCRYGVYCCKYRIFQRSVSLLRIRRTDFLR